MDRLKHNLEASDDDELLRLAKTNPAAFHKLYERYSAILYGWAYKQTGNHEVAADLAAETFAQAWRCRRRFKNRSNDGSVKAWLFGIAKNLLSDYRRKDRVKTAARKKLGMQLENATVGTVNDHEDLLERLSANQLKPELNQAFQRLPKKQRDALTLRVHQELGYEEIAKQLGCSTNAAIVRVSRAIQSLKTDLQLKGNTIL